MSTFNFNKIFILESLLSNELQTGSELEKRINQWAPTQEIDCQAVVFQVHSMQEWEIAWNGIYTSIEKMGNIPIIHLEMHGDVDAIGIDKGTKGIIPLIDVFKKVQHANVLSQNNVFLSLAVCKGLNVIRNLKVYEPMPFCGVLGSLETLKNNELLENYTVFYKSFLTTLNLDKAEQQMKNAGIDASKYQLFKPEQVFMNAYLGYLETYKTDEQIREKAIVAAKSGGVVFRDSAEENSFIREYRCSLLLTEDEEYQRAVDKFFIFDRYPGIRERFTVPHSIYEFKQYASENGHKWLSQRRPLSEDDIKSLSIRILNAVDEFCEKNGIKYSLAYGTLIGAVRHKGFIPWDDDIDIMMLRPDYDKFISLFNQKGPKLFSVASFETDEEFPLPLAKVMCNATINFEFGFSKYGFGIDVFPIDKIPTNDHDYRRILRKKKWCWNLFLLKSLRLDRKRSLRNNFFICISKLVVPFISYSFIQKSLQKMVREYASLADNYYLGNIYSPYGERDIFEKEIFSERVLLPFENQKYFAIKEYDAYLKKVYGNYMKLPPKELQVSHHEYEPYWK